MVQKQCTLQKNNSNSAMNIYISNLHSTRDELLAHFSIPFWLHILIGQWYVCAKKRAKADWLMTCAKADWLTTNVIIFPCSLIGQFKISLCYDFGCAICKIFYERFFSCLIYNWSNYSVFTLVFIFLVLVTHRSTRYQENLSVRPGGFSQTSKKANDALHPKIYFGQNNMLQCRLFIKPMV